MLGFSSFRTVATVAAAVTVSVTMAFSASTALAQDKGNIVVFMPPGTDNYLAQWQVGARQKAKDLGYNIKIIESSRDQRIAATRGAGSVEFVDAYSSFAGHEVGSSDPYMNGLAVSLSALAAEPRSFHPTVKGHEALARLFIEQIRKGPGRPLGQYR